MSDSVKSMNPDPPGQLQKPMASMPPLAKAEQPTKPQPVSALEKIRSSHPRSSRIPDATFRGLIVLTAISVFAIVVLVVWELIDKSRLSLHQFGLSFFYGHDWYR